MPRRENTCFDVAQFMKARKVASEKAVSENRKLQFWQSTRKSNELWKRSSSETQGLLVGTMRYFQASNIFGAKVYFKG